MVVEELGQDRLGHQEGVLEAHPDVTWPFRQCIDFLLVDIHYAGLVDAPLLIDVARIVSLVRKRSMHGLGALGDITDRSLKKTIEDKFVQDYNEIDAALTEDQQCRFRWDPVVAVHMLCKFYRAHCEGYYNRM